MSKDKKFKFYVLPKTAFHLSAEKEKIARKNIFNRIYLTFENIFYEIGSALISVCLKFWRAVVSDVKTTVLVLPARLRGLSKNKFYSSLLIFVLILAIGWGAIFGLGLIAKGLDLKDSILTRAFLGNSYLSKAKDELLNKNISGAQQNFTEAYKTFSKAQAEMSQSGQLVNTLLAVLPQKKAADNLLNAASLISSAGQDMASLETNFSNLKIGSFGVTGENGEARESLIKISDTINNSLEKILLATQLVSEVSESAIPKDQRQKFSDLKLQLVSLKSSLENFKSVAMLLKDFLLGDKTILVLFQNNNELRAGGGFMGTYGAFKVKDGFISSMKVSSIYDLDGQLLETIKPPQPLLNVGYRWYLRDSNWFANFPETATVISGFYEKEAGQTPDIILAVTPDLILDLFEVTGPIYLSKYGLTLTKENFVEKTQVQSTLSNDLPTNSPKQILADLFPILLDKISKTEGENWIKVLEAFQNQLNHKNLVLYSREENLQKTFESFNWSGSIAESDRDYLNIVSSNLGGTKTDLFMEQSVNLTTSLTKEGKLVNHLQITRKNKMPNLSDAENVSYLRILVPLGSKLISNNGFDTKNLEFPNDAEYKINDQVLEWEKNSITDNLTQTRIGEEAGKTYFANWLEVKGGESKTVNLTYELPFTLNKIDRYSLLVQKQIGAKPYSLSWKLDYNGWEVVWNNLNTEANAKSLVSDIIISKDQLLGVVLKK